MKRKSICIVFHNDSKNGGASTYEKAFEKIFSSEFKDQYKITFLYTNKNKYFQKFQGINCIYYNLNIFRFFFIRLLLNNNIRYFLNYIGFGKLSIEKKLQKMNIDLLIFTSPNPLALGINSIPFVSTVWDLGHRELPNYPETSLNGNFEIREEFYTKTLPKSSIVYVDSDVTAAKIKDIYGVDPNRICTLGFIWTLKYRDKKSIKSSIVKENDLFVLYPANFWYHKNHKFLIEIFNSESIRKSKLKLVLTGVDKGNLSSIKELVFRFNLEQNIIFAGHVSIEEMNYLYSKTLGIVFPSLLGPSNLPPLEALLFNKKSIVSDKHTSMEFKNNNIKISILNQDLWINEIIQLKNDSLAKSKMSNIEIDETKKLIYLSIEYFFNNNYK